MEQTCLNLCNRVYITGTLLPGPQSTYTLSWNDKDYNCHICKIPLVAVCGLMGGSKLPRMLSFYTKDEFHWIQFRCSLKLSSSHMTGFTTSWWCHDMGMFNSLLAIWRLCESRDYPHKGSVMRCFDIFLLLACVSFWINSRGTVIWDSHDLAVIWWYNPVRAVLYSRWRHDMDTLSTLLVIHAGNPPVTCGFHAQVVMEADL